jgi:hypothetical protein
MAYSTQTPSPNQRAQTREITFFQLMAMVLRTGVRKRGQHGRIHGCVRATFQVLDNIPTKYKVGIFATPGTYQAAIRFSSGPQANDRIPGAQGMAIKLIGVPGRKILKKQADATTHDFILLDFPVFFVRDTDSYARLVSELARSKPDAKPEKWLEWLGQSHPEDVAIAERYDARVVDNPLTQSFFSQVPYAFGTGGDTICRYGATPHPENKNAGPPPASADGNYLRQVMIDHLTTAAQPATFDFCVQLLTGATPEIIDTPTVEWGTPYQRVATITIMAQDFAQPDQDRFGQNLSYTPWHALPEHRPVGQINEIRRMVYAWSSGMRHLFNLKIGREPTSAIPPRPTGSCLGRVVKYTALAAAVSIALIGAFLWPKIHVDLPTYPAVEKQVWLEQNWKAGQREWYHHASQGGQFPPMISVPYEWFIALEQPVLAIGAAEPLADQHYLDRFGFIPSTSESGAYDWRHCSEPEGAKGYDSGKQLLEWRHRLPVGFACTDRRINPMVYPDGKPWLNAATGETMSGLGLTCAACHTGRFTYGTTEFLVDGGSAMTDLVKVNTAIGLALAFTKYDFLRFNRFALRLLGPDAKNEVARAALRKQLDSVVDRVFILNKLDGSANPGGDNEGYGRLDALNRIGNQVFAIDLDRPENYVGSTAPVHYPRIWDTPWFSWAQYNGSIEQPMVRNAGEALGTGSPIRKATQRPSTDGAVVHVRGAVPDLVRDGRIARRQAAAERQGWLHGPGLAEVADGARRDRPKARRTRRQTLRRQMRPLPSAEGRQRSVLEFGQMAASDRAQATTPFGREFDSRDGNRHRQLACRRPEGPDRQGSVGIEHHQRQLCRGAGPIGGKCGEALVRQSDATGVRGNAPGNGRLPAEQGCRKS